MIHPELYLNLPYNQKILFSLILISAVIIISIFSKMKKRANINKHVSYKRNKNSFSIDYDKFIKANFKKQEYLFENKNRKAELIRLLNY